MNTPFLHALLPCLLLAVHAVGQDETATAGSRSGGKGNPPTTSGLLPPGVLSEEELASGRTREEILKARPYPGSRGHCALYPAVTPHRVSPGGQGVLVVTMSMVGDMVLLAPPSVVWRIRPVQGPFEMGTPSFRPTGKTLKSSPALLGREVYDDYAIFEVPFAVGPEAAHGKHGMQATLYFDLHDGKTGEFFARFSQTASLRVDVGEPLGPPPRIPGAPPTGDVVPGPQPGGGAERDAATGSEVERPAGRGEVSGTKPVTATAPAEERKVDPIPEPDGDTTLMVVLGLAGLLGLLGIILALARKSGR